jgi:hypothetical protein
MRHYSPEEFMTYGQRNALRLADKIEKAEHFNMSFWTVPGLDLCPSCMASWAVTVASGRGSLAFKTGDELMKFAAEWLGFTVDQMRKAFIPSWVLQPHAATAPEVGHLPDEARRAVALLRHYAHTGEVTWQPQAAVIPSAPVPA